MDLLTINILAVHSGVPQILPPMLTAFLTAFRRPPSAAEEVCVGRSRRIDISHFYNVPFCAPYRKKSKK